MRHLVHATFLAIVVPCVQAEIVRLEPGKSAKASEVNGNFEFLAGRIDSLVKAMRAKDDSLDAVRARLDSAMTGTKSFTKGAVGGFLVAPDGDGYLPGSDKTWLLAGGQGVVNGVKIPDLRGVFLRGMELDKNIANTPAKYALRDSSQRKLEDFQADAFQGHWHQNLPGSEKYTQVWRSGNGAGTGGGLGAGTTQMDQNAFGAIVVTTPVADLVNGTPRIASETRPKNMAVYWYVKVK